MSLCRATAPSLWRAALAAAALALVSCGGPAGGEIVAAGLSPTAHLADWPPPAASPPSEATTVKNVLACADGAQVQVRAYLVAVTLPCPACNVGERTGKAEERGIGRSARPASPTMPGCLPCPAPVATFSDEVPTASGAPASAPLRAVGTAEGLQPRHVGKLFVLTGTFRVNGPTGPELDVTDVRAVEER